MDNVELFVNDLVRREIENIEKWNEANEAKIFATLIVEFYATERVLEKLIEEFAQAGHLDVRKHFEELKTRGRALADKKLSEHQTDAQFLLFVLTKQLALLFAISKKLLIIILRKFKEKIREALRKR